MHKIILHLPRSQIVTTGIISLVILVICVTACTSVATPLPTVSPDPTATQEPAIPTATAAELHNKPFPQHTQYASGSILPNHRTQEQLDDDVRAFYDYWKTTYLLEAGQNENEQPLYRVAFGKDLPNKDTTVSESQGYGMLIVPMMAGYDPDAQALFDGLWRFARAHPSEMDSRLMDWNVPDNESGNDSAFDGDADMAFGLLLADVQWGSQGAINYKAEAETLITAIFESTIGPDSRLPMLGDWTDANGEDFSQYTPRSSDFMLTNFRAYGAATGNPIWEEIINNSLGVMSVIQQNYSSTTGLIPDFIVMTGKNRNPEPSPADFLEGPNDGHYYYNAGRVPLRVGSYALLYQDITSRAIVRKLSQWAESTTNGDPSVFRSGYDLQGNPLDGSDYFTTFFVAPLGVAAMNNPDQQNWLNEIYDAVYNTQEDYYEDSVTLLCLLVMSGNFWAP